jgi:hypothetical protein
MSKAITKKQIAAMCSAIMGTWLAMRDRGMPGTVFLRVLSEKRVDAVLDGLRERVVWHEEHAAKDRGSAAHFRAHPHVYGKSTPEMIERCSAGAAKYDKGAAWFRALEQRVIAEGLPAEVIAYDPTVPR